MSLQVVSKSTDQDYATTGTLKQVALGATATSTAADAYLDVLVHRFSAWVDTKLGRGPLSVQTYRETVPAFGGRRLMLSRTPIRAIKAVYDGTDTGTASQLHTSEFMVEDADAGLIARDQGFAWTPTYQGRAGSVLSAWGGDALPLDPAPLAGQEQQSWLVDYVAGWTYGGVDTGSTNWSTEAGTTSTERTLPYDIETALLLRANMAYQGLDQSGVVEERLGDVEVKYRGYRSTGGDEEYDLLLEPFRRLA